ncbi:MAG: hypothetical protein QXI33_03415 [Candidatus Pacearchaeota archaeon]
MRNIESAEKIEARKRRNKIILGITIISLMVISTVGFAVFQGFGPIQGDTKKISYNGLEFILNQNGYWESTVQGITLNTINNPEDTKEIELNIQVRVNDFYNKPLYFVSENYEAMNELIRNIGPLSSRFQEACLKGERCEFDYVEKSCEDNIIIIRVKNETNTYKQDNCIFIEAPMSQHILISDKFIFRVYGIQ